MRSSPTWTLREEQAKRKNQPRVIRGRLKIMQSLVSEF